jgi:hypothetical protein
MSGEQILVDPTSETEVAGRQRLPRPTSIEGLTVAVLDISKPRGDVFLDRISELFGERGIEVKRYRKPTVIRPAPLDIQQAIVDECDIVVEGLAD